MEIKTVNQPSSRLLPETVAITMTGTCSMEPFRFFLPTLRDRATPDRANEAWRQLAQELNQVGLNNEVAWLWQLVLTCRTGSFFSARGKSYVVSLLVDKPLADQAIKLAREIVAVIDTSS